MIIEKNCHKQYIKELPKTKFVGAFCAKRKTRFVNGAKYFLMVRLLIISMIFINISDGKCHYQKNSFISCDFVATH